MYVWQSDAQENHAWLVDQKEGNGNINTVVLRFSWQYVLHPKFFVISTSRSATSGMEGWVWKGYDLRLRSQDHQG
jgi:hypothetical protein